MKIWLYTIIYIYIDACPYIYLYILYIYIYTYSSRNKHTHIYTYIHTYHTITLHYIILHYITLHYIMYLHTYIVCVSRYIVTAILAPGPWGHQKAERAVAFYTKVAQKKMVGFPKTWMISNFWMVDFMENPSNIWMISNCWMVDCMENPSNIWMMTGKYPPCP